MQLSNQFLRARKHARASRLAVVPEPEDGDVVVDLFPVEVGPLLVASTVSTGSPMCTRMVCVVGRLIATNAKPPTAARSAKLAAALSAQLNRSSWPGLRRY